MSILVADFVYVLDLEMAFAVSCKCGICGFGLCFCKGSRSRDESL